jgi:hypothetical protein
MGWSWDRYSLLGAFTRSPILVRKNDPQRHWKLPARIHYGNASDPLDVVDVSKVETTQTAALLRYGFSGQ